MKKNPSWWLALALCVTGGGFQAKAGTVFSGIIRDSRIETTVTDNGDGTYTYEYTVVNDSPGPQQVWGEVETWPAIVGYEIPLDSPSVVWDLNSPATWDYRFLSAVQYETEYGEPNSFNSAYVLQWYDAEFFSQPSARMIVPGGYNARFEANEYEPSASGFSLVSNLAPTDGPYANLWFDAERNIGDPPLPGGGMSGGVPYNPVPEVPAAGWMVVGLLAFGLVRKYRNRD